MTRRIKAFFKTEHDKLKVMTFNEKRLYLWEYYKFQFFIAVLLLFILGTLINSWFINPPKREFLHVAWMGWYIDTERLDLLAEYFTYAVDDPKTQQVVVTSFAMGENPQFNAATQNRFTAMLAAGMLDIFLVSKADAAELVNFGYVRSLREAFYPNFGFSPDESSGLYDSMENPFPPFWLFVEYRPEEGAYERDVFGFSLEGIQIFDWLSIDANDLYICAVANSKKTEAMAQLLLMLYG